MEEKVKIFFKLAAAPMLLLLASCAIEDSYDGEVIFYNFSPAGITVLNVYDLVEDGRWAYKKNKLVYAYASGIKHAGYHQFELSEGMGYFFQVVTEEGETYEGGPFWNSGHIYAIFSVDYDVLEYGEGGRL
jgi:hypothetical protein